MYVEHRFDITQHLNGSAGTETVRPSIYMPPVEVFEINGCAYNLDEHGGIKTVVVRDIHGIPALGFKLPSDLEAHNPPKGHESSSWVYLVNGAIYDGKHRLFIGIGSGESSIHSHPKNYQGYAITEHYRVKRGEVLVHVQRNGVLFEVHYRAGDAFVIHPGEYHQATALTPGTVTAIYMENGGLVPEEFLHSRVSNF